MIYEIISFNSPLEIFKCSKMRVLLFLILVCTSCSEKASTGSTSKSKSYDASEQRKMQREMTVSLQKEIGVLNATMKKNELDSTQLSKDMNKMQEGLKQYAKTENEVN
jgi:hypothetical protein